MSDGNQSVNTSRPSANEGERQGFYNPPQELAENSNIMTYAREKGFANVDELYAWTIKEPQQFWSEMATRFLDWYQPFETVLDESERSILQMVRRAARSTSFITPSIAM